ncbi:hypothetical protein BJY16_004831 [Actinoplanes octamycinicus]|uniref:AB hydrolase-1 domain-containing protein n=1 Tax=Actinoplanes octamycinicus TaxID=135948 RepID=A0A7W7H014_9ACTN|nr:alpha/beta hydrolase [Actinoplanes octamycinicus]MBB4741372.1 hypothetical protein [Actinoplanes octamycinicus]GIE62830.1 hypothetical protein Aoc01nite_82320 [Actinoplanes octamycinicus]
MTAAFVLLHSLLLGPLTWSSVASRLPARTVVPVLTGVTAGDPPFWPHVAGRVNDALATLPAEQPVVLVAHSNAGLMVPPVVAAACRPVVGCAFVDATLPARTGPTPVTSPERLAVLRGMAVDGRLPPWTTWWDDVAELFPDEGTRAAVTAEQPRLPLSYYEQRIPVPAGWDARPCGYLLFSPAYQPVAREAAGRGWPVTRVPGGHLHQVVDPDAVAGQLTAMTAGFG